MRFSEIKRTPISGEEENILLEFGRFLTGFRSPGSIAAYQSDIRLFAEHTPGVDLLHITAAQEDNYLANLQSRGLKRRTLRRKGTSLRYFREFMTRNIDLTQERLAVQGRGDRRRFIGLPESVLGVLSSYLPTRLKKEADSSAPLVVNLRGGRLTVRSIARTVEHLASLNKLPEGTHPQTLRHAYASHNLRNGKTYKRSGMISGFRE